MKRYVLPILFLLCMQASAWGQQEVRATAMPLHLGVEQDVLPYLLKGYIFTGWMGRNGFRCRFSYAEADAPKFILGDGMARDRVKAFGISFEYFFWESFRGLWLGPGIGYWTNFLRSEAGDQGQNESVIFSLGGGYNYFFNDWLYASPWCALHTRMSGRETVMLGGTAYNPALFTPEFSLKLGVKLRTKMR